MVGGMKEQEEKEEKTCWMGTHNRERVRGRT